MSDPVSETTEVQVSAGVQPTPALSPQAMMDLVNQGQRTLSQGRAEEALRIADSILEDQPDAISALALKGDSLDRLGLFAEALECYERVLELKPDSALDRIRASQLKKQLEAPAPASDEAPTRRTALLAGVGAAVLALAVGIPLLLFFSQNQRPAEESKLLASNSPGYMAENFPSVAPVPTTGDSAQTNRPSPVPPSAPDQQTRTTTQGASAIVTPGYTGSSGSGASRLPNQGPDLSGAVPVNPVPNGLRDGLGVQPVQPGSRTDNGLNQPSGTSAQADAPEPIRPAEQGPKEDPGVIDIRPSASSTNSGRVGNSGSQEASDDEAAKQSSETLVRVARDAFVRGDYARAADAYEKALRQGASRGSTNQRLAQCYERLGRKADAIAAYERAISAYQSSLSSGSGDSSRVQAALDTCRQALKVLRG